MRKIKEVLRLKYEADLSYETIASSCNIGYTTVGEYLNRAKKAGLRWPLPEDMDDNLLERLFIHDPLRRSQQSHYLTGTVASNNTCPDFPPEIS